MHLHLGVFFALGAMTLWGLEELFLKKSIRGLGSITTLLINTIVGVSLQAVVIGLFFRKELTLISQEDVWRVILVAGIAFLGYLFFYWALERQDLSLISALDNSWIVIAAVIAVIFFGERIGGAHLAAMAAVLGGGFFISANFASLKHIRFISGSGYELLSVLAVGIVVPLDKMLIDRIGEANTILYTGVLILPLIGIARSLGAGAFVRPTRPLWKVSVASGIVDGIAFAFYILAIAFAPISVVAPILASSVLVSVGLARIYLKERISPKEVAGMALILFGVLYLSIRFG